MREFSVNKFRANLKNIVDRVISEHEPVRIHGGASRGFIVLSAEDWEREQETLYILQNSSLMKQISESLITHNAKTGYEPPEKDASKF